MNAGYPHAAPSSFIAVAENALFDKTLKVPRPENGYDS
jgi:hypothetical protein